MFDWGAGEYERTAAELEPAARHVVALAEIAAGSACSTWRAGPGTPRCSRPPAARG